MRDNLQLNFKSREILNQPIENSSLDLKFFYELEKVNYIPSEIAKTIKVVTLSKYLKCLYVFSLLNMTPYQCKYGYICL